MDKKNTSMEINRVTGAIDEMGKDLKLEILEDARAHPNVPLPTATFTP